MYIDEMPIGSEVTIQVYRGKENVDLVSEVVEMDKDLRGLLSKKARFVPIKLIEEEGKVVSFPENLHYHTIISSGGSPLIWYELSIRYIQHPSTGERWHIILAEKEGKVYNRRENFRLFMGCNGTAVIGTSQKNLEVLIKDISAQGVGFVLSTQDCRNISIGDKVHLKFRDGVDANNTMFNIVTNVVRIDDMDSENRCLVGCMQDKYSDTINKYILNKQREQMKKQRQ